MKNNKILKIILIIILIVILIIISNIVRKYIILKNISQKLVEYSTKTSYHITQYFYGENAYAVDDIYHKGDNSFIKRNSAYYYDNALTTEESIITLKNGKSNIYYTSSNEKKAILNCNYELVDFFNYNNFEYLSFRQFLIVAMRSKITFANINGIDCYKIEQGNTKLSNWRVLYIEKQTGLRMREENITVSYSPTENSNNENIEFKDNTLTDYTYEFDNVSDEIFTEPDISQYRVEEEN